MARIPWREGKVVSIETRPGVFALGQMLTDPYMLFFNLFSDSLDWPVVALDSTPHLFIKGVVRQFLFKSNAKYQKHLKPAQVDLLIHRISPGFDPVIREVWTGTPLEMKVGYIGEHLSLVEVNLALPGREQDASKRTVIPTIAPNDEQTIENHETAALEAYPYLNERLYLCHSLGRNVDVLKDLMFYRPLPIEYETWIRHLAHVKPDEVSPAAIEACPYLYSERKSGRRISE